MAEFNQNGVFSSGERIRLRFENIINESTNLLIQVGDVTGITWAMTPYEDDVTPLIQKSLSGGTITIPENGVVVVQLNEADTFDLSGEFTHELRISDADGAHVAARGKLTIKYQVANNPI